MPSLFAILIFFISSNSIAQINEDTTANEIVNYADSQFYEMGGQMGNLLPFGISGVRDNYPLVGILYSHPTVYGNLEYILSSAKAKGVSWYEGLLSLRIDYTVYDFFSGYFRLGAQGVHYQGDYSETGNNNFETSYGSHFGFGSYFQMAGPYWGRVDFKFGFGPGNTLNITAGIIYRWGSESDNKN
ncbi:MAG: hypothetical protein H6625_01820 [Bdellovibrionaceae bacterium]|nr:hypothetical protein [Pseudobdellovibrionaceae bacterium]